MALALLNSAGPLSVISANNLAGRPGARTAAEALTGLEDKIELLLNGG